MSLDAATRAQNAAADPRQSTWLSANAGSGKTRVLTDRVARLLLAGAPPQNILCLTYTKAAAGEMQNRLFRTLGKWSMMPDATLSEALAAIDVDQGIKLNSARTLFARAIEAPGGLKIQTIHSFCAALLRQFPIEAGVSPTFVEIDESTQRSLIREILEELAEEDSGGAISLAARHLGSQDLESVSREIVSKRLSFDKQLDLATLLGRYGAPPDLTWQGLWAHLDFDPELFQRLMSSLKSGSTSDLKLRDSLISIDASSATEGALELLEARFLTGSSASSPFTSKAGKLPTKAVREALGLSACDAIDAFMNRVELLRPLRLALGAAERTHALHQFAKYLLPAYASAKAARGWLDFDDLIERTTTLLEDSSAAAWVLYRLDARIDHILVDESQDTSPAQWRVIDALVSEFGAGEGARTGTERTVFVVGDKKQSIYSFQGADAEAFETIGAHFDGRLAASGGLARRDLLHSFRSAPVILDAVDSTFSGQAGSGLGGSPRHIPFHESRPGRVELWPLVRKSETDNTGVWYEPVDRVAPEDPSSVLAQAIATRIAAMIADPYETIGEGKSARRLNAGDFLVLVRGRTGQGDIFQTIIRGLKSEGLRVAGADVMRLDSEMAVKDLKALLEFLALPEDSLALATVLRSPLLGWSEGDLYSLAAPREETYLWRALENRAEEFPETVALLRDLRDASDYQRPYELIERILVRHGGRRRLIARLGAECEEAIDAFLGQVLTFERDQIPSLTGFLAWLDGQSAVVKRALDQSGGGVRVMTVHGAKGLEAPVVILPDTMRGEQRERSACLIDSDGLAHWLGARAERPNTLSAAAEMQETKTARERQRLLYVAMTRAESRLIVCGAGEESALDGTWYAAVQEGLRRAEAEPLETPLGTGLVLRSGTFDPVDSPVEKTGKAPDPILPAWANEAAPDPLQGAVRSPSDLGGAKALPGEGRSKDEALRRGAQIHLLLEHLSHVNAPERDALAVTLLGHGDLALSAPDAAQLTAEVSSLLDAPSLKYVFAPDTLAEVSVTAALPELGGTRIHGVIDRLVITDSSVLIVDYKTNEVVPSDPREVPEGILRQMGAYRAAIQQVYPDRAVDTAVLWTTTGTLMDLPNEIVMNALERTTTS